VRVRETRAISLIILILAMALLTWVAIAAILRRRSQIVSVRGMGTTADIGRLHDMPRVQVRDLTVTGPDSARLVVAATGDDDGAGAGAESEFLIAINEGDPGFGLLHEWIDQASVLGIVVPPDSRLLRLRCLADLQPLTLRRLDA
jgi:hypothetical protein